MKVFDSAGMTRPSLLLRLRDARDTAAWNDFGTTYAPLIHRYARRKGLNDADASDVSQEVLAAVAASIGRFDYQPEIGSFRSWLGAVTQNHLRKFWARASRRVTAATGDQLPSLADLEQNACVDVDPDWLTQFTEYVLEVAQDRIRGEFEPSTWNMFIAVWRDDEPARAVAVRQGVTIHAVYVAKSRVLKRLRDEVLTLVDDMATPYPHD